ncbi:MAG TPA: hypothetical protein VIO83_06200 [Pseudomonas sp.]
MPPPWKELRSQSPLQALRMIAQRHASHLVRHGAAQASLPAPARVSRAKPPRKKTEEFAPKTKSNSAEKTSRVKYANFSTMLAIHAQRTLGFAP